MLNKVSCQWYIRGNIGDWKVYWYSSNCGEFVENYKKNPWIQKWLTIDHYMLWKQLWNCWCTDLVGRYLFWESRFEADVYISQSTLVSDWAKTVSEEKIEDTISCDGSFPCLGSFSCHRIFCTQAISKHCWANFNFNIRLDSITSWILKRWKRYNVWIHRNVLLIVADDAGRQLGHLGDPLVWLTYIFIHSRVLRLHR